MAWRGAARARAWRRPAPETPRRGCHCWWSTPPASTVVSRTNGPPDEIRAMTVPVEALRSGKDHEVASALNSDSPSATSQPTSGVASASGTLSGATIVTYPAATPARFREPRASSSSSGRSAMEIIRLTTSWRRCRSEARPRSLCGRADGRPSSRRRSAGARGAACPNSELLTGGAEDEVQVGGIGGRSVRGPGITRPIFATVAKPPRDLRGL